MLLLLCVAVFFAICLVGKLAGISAHYRERQILREKGRVIQWENALALVKNAKGFFILALDGSYKIIFYIDKTKLVSPGMIHMTIRDGMLREEYSEPQTIFDETRPIDSTILHMACENEGLMIEGYSGTLTISEINKKGGDGACLEVKMNNFLD